MYFCYPRSLDICLSCLISLDCVHRISDTLNHLSMSISTCRKMYAVCHDVQQKKHRYKSVLNTRLLASVEFFVECFYSTGSSVNTLFTTVEWMAYVADFYFDIFFGSRSGFEFVTASADNFYSIILWVNTFSHLLHLFLEQSS